MNVARALAAAGVALVAGCGGDAVTLTLRYHPAAGASFHYEMEQGVDYKMAGDSAPANGQTMTIIIAFTQSVTGPVDGGTEVRIRVDSVGLSSPHIPPDALRSAGRMLRGLETATVFDERMQIVRSSVAEAGEAPPQLAAQLGASLRGATFALPDGPVRVGGTWTTEMPAPMGQIPGLGKPIMLTSRLRLKSFRVAGGDTIVTIDVATSFPRDPIPLEFAGPGAAVQIEGSLQGEQEYSLARHAVIASTMGGTVRTTTKGVPEGDSGATIGQRLTMRLVEDRAAP